MENESYEPSEMAELDLGSLAEDQIPEGHKSGIVAVAGRPNVGKSTLMNAYLRQKIAIVSPRPQTTRSRQLGILTEPDYQIIFVDTPGLIKPRHKLDEYMVTAADNSIRDADFILWLVDASEPVGAGDKFIAGTLKGLVDESSVILAMNKSDLLAPDEVIERSSAYHELMPGAEWILISAANGNGLDQLLQMIVNALEEGPRFYPADQTTDSFVRDIAAELIREQIFLKMRDELPYGTAVAVDEFKERENGIIYIKATIFVERDNHKKIIIGAKGSQLRLIGAAARREIEELIEQKVYLDLWIKVVPNWRRDDAALKRLGYAS
jgi:GTP-binding protein Era